MPQLDTVTFKCPADLLDRLPAPGQGRSRFIIDSLREKLSEPDAPRGWASHASDMDKHKVRPLKRSTVADDRAKEEAR